MNYAKLFTKRGDGRYVATIVQDGKRRYLYDRDPEMLYNKLEQLKHPDPLTFRAMAERWYGDMQAVYKDGTWAMYDAPYNRALKRFGDEPGQDITSADIALHLAEMAQRGYGERTLKAQRTVYSLIYKHAAQIPELVEAARYNPAALAALPRDRRRPQKRKAPEDEAITRIILGLSSSFGLFPYLLLCTGLRRGEALGLTWGDVDYKRQTIVVNRGVTYRRGKKTVGDTKTEGSVRTVPLLGMLAVALKHYQEDKDHFIFHGEDPLAPLSEATYRRRWHRWCRENGFAVKVGDVWEYHLTAHVLRHGYATLSSRGGLETGVIKDLLGHENERTTEIYIDERPIKVEEFQAIATTIEAAINGIFVENVVSDQANPHG